MLIVRLSKNILMLVTHKKIIIRERGGTSRERLSIMFVATIW